jgi:hypothetical protein
MPRTLKVRRSLQHFASHALIGVMRGGVHGGTGRFQVDGSTISWTSTRFSGPTHRYTGTLQRGGKRIEVTATDDPDKAKLKGALEFRALKVAPFVERWSDPHT